MEKIRGNNYRLNELSVGDRFFIASDKKRIPLEVVTVTLRGDKAVEEIQTRKTPLQKFPDVHAGTGLYKLVTYLRTITP